MAPLSKRNPVVHKYGREAFAVASYLFEIFKFLRIEDVQRTICEIWISPLPSRMHFFLHLWVGKFKWSVIFYTK
jgi:hypothetical protein